MEVRGLYRTTVANVCMSRGYVYSHSIADKLYTLDVGYEPLCSASHLRVFVTLYLLTVHGETDKTTAVMVMISAIWPVLELAWRRIVRCTPCIRYLTNDRTWKKKHKYTEEGDRSASQLNPSLQDIGSRWVLRQLVNVDFVKTFSDKFKGGR